eukprot:1782278-Amphidinium_carterae.1
MSLQARVLFFANGTADPQNSQVFVEQHAQQGTQVSVLTHPLTLYYTAVLEPLVLKPNAHKT